MGSVRFNSKIVFGFLILCVLTYVSFRFIQNKYVFFIPFAMGIVLILRTHPLTGLGIVLSYMSIDGAAKLLTGNMTIFRIAIDILIIFLCFTSLRLNTSSLVTKSIFRVPLITLFWFHMTWIVIQFFNPYSIGIAPSIAAYKVYISALFLYFITYTYVEKEEDVSSITNVMFGLLFVQVFFSIYQFQVGEAGLGQWSRYYILALGDKFQGIFFRPFGTSNVPGGGTTLIFLVAPIALGIILKKLSAVRTVLSFVLLTVTIYVLLISQVRAALIKFFVGNLVCMSILIYRNPRSFVQFAAIIGISSFLILYFLNVENEKFQVAQQRLEQLSEANKVWEDRSKGTFESIIQIVTEQPLGIGLSRVGAASQPFQKRIERDAFYGLEWVFADNLYKALLVEIGIPGLIFFVAFFMGTVGIAIRASLLKVNNESLELVGLKAGLMGAVMASITGHIGSEGFLYQPECTIVWVSLGLLIKSEKIAKTSSKPYVPETKIPLRNYFLNLKNKLLKKT